MGLRYGLILPAQPVVPIVNSLPPPVQAVIDSYPKEARAMFLAVRKLLYGVARQNAAIGQLTETLKWGEPAYLTEQSKSGSTVRVAWNAKNPECLGLYFNCQTNLVDTFRTLFPHDFEFAGNRALMLSTAADLPSDAIAMCVEAAMTYHLDKRRAS